MGFANIVGKEIPSNLSRLITWLIIKIAGRIARENNMKKDFNNSILIQKADYDMINLLDVNQKGELLHAIFEYQVNEKEISIKDDKTKIIFLHFKGRWQYEK